VILRFFTPNLLYFNGSQFLLTSLLYMQFLYGCNELIGIVFLKFVHVYHNTRRTQILSSRLHRYSMNIAPEYLDIVDNLNVLKRTFSGPKKPDLWPMFWV
jgi:hypothetical protein